MFDIKPTCIYTKQDLAKKLKGICHVETFLRRIHPHRVLKNGYYGQDLLTAIERSLRMDEDEIESHNAPAYSNRSGCRRGKAPEIQWGEIHIR